VTEPWRKANGDQNPKIRVIMRLALEKEYAGEVDSSAQRARVKMGTVRA
jgi:hypothetical protein